MYCYTCLTNLTVVFAETSIYSSTARAYFCMKFLSKFEQHVESFLTSHTVTTCNHNRSTFQIMFCFLNMTVDNLYYIICFGYIFRNVVTNNLTLIVSINNFFLHHSFTNSRHLRTVFRIDDSSYNVTTKSWTNLIQQIFISNPILLVFMITDFQLSTVGSQTTCQS